MALTDRQKLDCARWSGYSIISIDYPTIIDVLEALDSTQETVLVDLFLTPLATLETDVTAAAENLDTDIAGPWTRNKLEVSDRRSMFRLKCREMCAFLGFEPGPGLGAGGITLVRC